MNRRDGIKLKDKDGMHSLMPFIMPKRCDADVYINMNVDVTKLVKYTENLKKKDDNITYFHVFCAAMAKVVYERPLLNRFVINKQYYDRKDVSISFVAKKEFNDSSEELFSVIKADKNDNIHSMSKKIYDSVHKIRSKKSNNTDKAVNVLGKLPKFIRGIVVAVLKFMDNHDLLPSSLTENLIYYSTILVSNLGSIKSGAIYHHLTDFGTNSILITIGEIKDTAVVVNGKVEVKKMCEFGVTLDERIADGYYFVKSMKLLEKIMDNPECLEDDFNAKFEESDR